MPVKPRPRDTDHVGRCSAGYPWVVPVVETMRLGPQRKRTMAEIDDDPRVAPSEDEQGSNVAPTTAMRLKNTRGQPWQLTIRQQFSRLS
jgi:hypothetical protein